jgi:DNA-binding PadR family transcriptional regulator
MAVSKVEVVVLGLLADESLYGYDLLERFRTCSLSFWAQVGKASVYQSLQRLESRGLVSGKAQDGAEGPDRRVFRITKAGRDRLKEGLAERFDEQARFETEAGLALGFSYLLPPTELRKAVDARQRALHDSVNSLRTERARAAADRGAARATANAMLDRQEALAKAELAWLATFKAGRRR